MFRFCFFSYFFNNLCPTTHKHLFSSPFSGTSQVSQYQKGKTSLDFTEARDSVWLWHQLGHMQVCTSLQTDNHASTPTTQFFTGRMPFLPPSLKAQICVRPVISKSTRPVFSKFSGLVELWLQMNNLKLFFDS